MCMHSGGASILNWGGGGGGGGGGGQDLNLAKENGD